MPGELHLGRQPERAQSLRAPPPGGSTGRGPLRLPTEVQFARHYGVSLTTVRQALSSLAAEGLISRHRRRGTFVNADALRIRALRVLGSADAVMAQQSSDEVRVLGRTRVRSGALPAQLGPVREAVLIRLLRSTRACRSATRRTIFTPSMRPGSATRPWRATRSPRSSATSSRCPCAGSTTRSPPASAPADVAALLRIDALTPVLVSENVTYAAGATPVDVARIHYRGDRFTFAISLDIP